MRFIVLEDAAVAAVAAAAEELADKGWAVVDGWPASPPSREIVCVGHVTVAADAAAAVLAALRGARLVVVADAERPVIDQLCDDLRRLGELDHRIGAPAPVLTPDQRQLIAHLLGGATLGAAAQALHLSRRTADRRLAAARAALGARTTPEALRAAAALGVRPAN